MGVALEIITGSITNVATLTTVTMNGSDSLTIRYCDPNKKIWLLGTGIMTDALGAPGLMEIRSPKLHDNVHGLRFRNQGGNTPYNLLPESLPQRLYPQDTLAWQIGGNAGAASVNPAWMLIYYEDLQGIAARLIDLATVRARMVELFTQEVTLTGGATGAYSASVALNANFDLMKPNTDYALLGYTVDRSGGSLHVKGADSGNLRIGGPASATAQHITIEWFARLTQLWGIPLICTFNSAAKAGISLDVVTDHNAGTYNTVWVFAELAPK